MVVVESVEEQEEQVEQVEQEQQGKQEGWVCGRDWRTLGKPGSLGGHKLRPQAANRFLRRTLLKKVNQA